MITIEAQINDALDTMGEALDLSPSAHETAVKRYEAVGAWLAEDEQFKDVDANIFPQGSFAMGTVVKPKLDSDEYDLDLIFEIHRPRTQVNARSLHKAVGVRLSSNGRYADTLEQDNRCWTLKYQGEFNMDIVPAVHVGYPLSDQLAIPDRDLGRLIDSNPKGIGSWFKSRSEIGLPAVRKVMADSREVDIADVPKQTAKTSLQRAVQLLKRHRNENFQDDKIYAPSSFLITILSGLAYAGETSTLEAVRGILDRMPQLVSPSHRLYLLWNPALPSENVLEHWNRDPKYPQEFSAWHSKALNMVGLSLRADSTESLYQAFGSGLGDTLVKRAATIQGNRVRALREIGALQMSVGTGILVSAPKAPLASGIPKHTFYGGDRHHG
ncbi:MAG TPA: nucleotidyltransferase [bacterium]|jgi:hypothetical protein|nr:nucleotidyltransferase [bacterium]